MKKIAIGVTNNTEEWFEFRIRVQEVNHIDVWGFDMGMTRIEWIERFDLDNPLNDFPDWYHVLGMFDVEDITLEFIMPLLEKIAPEYLI